MSNPGRRDIIQSSLLFIYNNFLNILMIAIFFFFIASYTIMNNVTFPSDNAKVRKVVIMETMKNKALKEALSEEEFDAKIKSGFCQKSSKTLHGDELEKEINRENAKCQKLKAKSTCTSATCCVWATTKKGKGLCLGGDKSGPTKNPPNLNIDSYYYLEKKYKL